MRHWFDVLIVVLPFLRPVRLLCFAARFTTLLDRRGARGTLCFGMARRRNLLDAAQGVIRLAGRVGHHHFGTFANDIIARLPLSGAGQHCQAVEEARRHRVCQKRRPVRVAHHFNAAAAASEKQLLLRPAFVPRRTDGRVRRIIVAIAAGGDRDAQRHSDEQQRDRAHWTRGWSLRR